MTLGHGASEQARHPADAAKYDAPCASSNTTKRDSRDGGIGTTAGMGICHAYAPDGRCIGLLANACVYDCLYCVNRRAAPPQPRAGEVVEPTGRGPRSGVPGTLVELAQTVIQAREPAPGWSPVRPHGHRP
jgi:hypothetical protein